VVNSLWTSGKFSIYQLRICRVSVDPFAVDSDDFGIILLMMALSRLCNVLLYGDPGAGKTEVSKALESYSFPSSVCPARVYLDGVFFCRTVIY
jgi:hypothetical protein